ncbi:MFS transporter [Bacillus sp. 31A1R]|uniref:MFS transporter n=1 Tax=Robertmurraya mangrovi TaxID=3098077 RepID=A0ABU5J0K3_9BACI|nr:MFS transporter [Bacillus sp. 31A1R]MDZ5472870.1 MFS transporter [Bacillus sp. 31A1R]
MSKIFVFFKQFHPVVWTILVGMILIRGAAFMTLPFLSIYLSRNLDVNPWIIGITVGISPLMSTVGGFIGGQLSDRWGRKPIMLFSLFTIAVVYFGFMIADHAGWFILLNAVLGLCNAFFEPTSQALIADLTTKENRMLAYSLRYTAINIGAAVGPLVGVYLISQSAQTTFFYTGLIYFIYGLVLMLILSKYSKTNSMAVKSNNSFREAFHIVKKDKALRYLIFGGILINMGYAQNSSNLPQHLEGSIENGVVLYSILLSINAVLVVFLSMPVSMIVSKFKPMQVMKVGAILTSLGLIGFGMSQGWVIAIIAMTLLTLGEILIFPTNSLLIDELASEQLRGTYFGASQFRKLGSFLGPVLGGYLFNYFDGPTMFMIISIISLGSLYFFTIGNRVYANAHIKEVSNFN